MRPLITAALAAMGTLASADGVGIHSRVDSHAPIGVMGDHTHRIGEFMFSYRFMRMHMSGMRDGTDNLEAEQVLQDFTVTPVQMDMEMHMLGAMYAPTERLTLMAMTPYVRNEMVHLTRMGGVFTTESSGLGDIKLSGLYTLSQITGRQWHMNLGLSVPTGKTDERDATPMSSNALLPYPMQLGSGTCNLTLGITHNRQ